MQLFGDESGHLRSILQGDCDLFVVGLVAGDSTRCRSCPKKAVRNIQDINEAHWSELTQTQKRRLVDCLTASEEELSFGYIAIEPADLHELDKHYRFYEEDLEYAWDLCVIGDCYAELVLQLVDGGATNPTFTFDEFMSGKMSNRIVDVMADRVDGVSIEYGNSRQISGIQTADCFAGAVREHLSGDRNWLDEFDSHNIVCGTEYALATVERRLYEGSTGP